jgi:acid phosphatase type 7
MSTRVALALVAAAAALAACGSPATRAQPVGARETVVAAAGDIACDPTDPSFNDNAGTPTACHEKATSDAVLAMAPAAVLALGDLQYVHADARYYQVSYHPTWGRFKAITRAVIGNHEGGEGGSNKAYFAYFGAAAGDPKKGYYSFELGGWHVIALNSNCGLYGFNGSHGGCDAGSPQDTWLQQDLAAHPTGCRMALFHVPRFTSSADHHSDAASDRTLTTLWEDLYSAGVDVVLNGHAHVYERFAPLNPAGGIDEASGIREFVVGTGGDNHGDFGPVVPGSGYRDNTTFGVLKLTLRTDSYAWDLVPDGTPGGGAADSGTATCHRTGR